eukprot:TRINITY_DN24647_c0_g1_i1.p1 TRINITY_DN24647_c0_g1~~TRINITY_DN24647_c0_g1_i1.p1  ORF type:complete len:312 (+),score=59.73 TRINITY_DN24647_c0_g1_i1:80-1015(+)
MPTTEIAKKAVAALQKKEQASDVLHRLCLEAGVVPLDVATHSGKKEVLKTLNTYTALKDTLLERAESHISDHSHLLSVCEMVFGMYGDEVPALKVVECLSSVASMCGICVKDAELSEIADLLVPFQIKTPVDLYNIFVLGPYSKLKFPRGWWKLQEPLPTTTAKTAYVLKEYSGLVISYKTDRCTSDRFYQVKTKNHSIEEVIKLVDKFKHILSRQQRERLIDRIRDGEWESIEVDESAIEIDPENPDWNTLKGDLKDVNLQSAPATLVDACKAKMDGKFEENLIKKDDPNYEYDSRAKFTPVGNSEWDSD